MSHANKAEITGGSGAFPYEEEYMKGGPDSIVQINILQLD